MLNLEAGDFEVTLTGAGRKKFIDWYWSRVSGTGRGYDTLETDVIAIIRDQPAMAALAQAFNEQAERQLDDRLRKP